MLVTPVVNNAPYPVTAAFQSYGSTLLIHFAGTAWTQNGGPIEAHLKMDGEIVATARAYSNETFSHKALVPAVAVASGIKSGAHAITVEPGDNTVCDGNDVFTIAITEFRLSTEGGGVFEGVAGELSQ
jgi:hypothetical protein